MIKLNIKSPTSVEDKCLESTLKSTVKEVKLQIEQEWPSHPSPKDQRLVYAGKLLADDSILQDVLRLEDARDENDAFTVHLVCRITTTPLPTTKHTGPTTPQENNHLRRRPINPTTPEGGQPPSTSPSPTSSPSTPWSPDQQQAALMHQMYANYMTQYVQYLQSIGAMNSWPQSAAQGLVDHTNQVAEEARAVQQPPVFDPVAAAAVAGAMANNLQPHQPPAQPQQPQNVNQINQVPVENNNIDGPNVVMNAGAGGIGAMEDEDDLNGGQRDVLDWCYVVTRVLVLFSVVYFYSSLARFALAAGLGIIFYLYNNGFFGQPQRPQDQQHQDAAVNEVRQVAGAAGDRVQEENQDENQEQRMNEAASEEVIEAMQPPPPHPLQVLSTFVTTFFTSLLPNDPQIV